MMRITSGVFAVILSMASLAGDSSAMPRQQKPGEKCDWDRMTLISMAIADPVQAVLTLTAIVGKPFEPICCLTLFPAFRRDSRPFLSGCRDQWTTGSHTGETSPVSYASDATEQMTFIVACRLH
jgi:hypothetical protein